MTDTKREYMRQYRINNRDRIRNVSRVQKKNWAERNKELVRDRSKTYTRTYRTKHKEKLSVKWKLYYQTKFRFRKQYMNEALKLEIMGVYGKDGKPQCSGCGIYDLDVLTIDHVNNDGKTERKQLKIDGGVYFYKYLRSRGYPKGYQTLCMNCNLKKEITRRRSLLKKQFKEAS